MSRSPPDLDKFRPNSADFDQPQACFDQTSKLAMRPFLGWGTTCTIQRRVAYPTARLTSETVGPSRPYRARKAPQVHGAAPLIRMWAPRGVTGRRHCNLRRRRSIECGARRGRHHCYLRRRRWVCAPRRARRRPQGAALAAAAESAGLGDASQASACPHMHSQRRTNAYMHANICKHSGTRARKCCCVSCGLKFIVCTHVYA